MTVRWRALFTATLLLVARPAAAEDSDYERGPGTARDEECLVCHAGVGEEEAPKLDVDLYSKTAHGEEGCIGCHADVVDESIQHEEEDEDLAPVNCGTCHEAAADDYVGSVHRGGRDVDRSKLAAGAPEGPTKCASCHGNHDIRPPKDPQSRVSALRQVETCGQCHGADRRAAGHPLAAPTNGDEVIFDGDGHPDAIGNDSTVPVDEGPLVSASCSDCHGSHRVHTTTVAASTLFPANVSDTCESCHKEQVDEFRDSAHDKAAHAEDFDWSEALRAAQADDHQANGHSKSDEGPTAPPVCTTCHRMHETAATPETARFREDLVHECGTCHEALMETYVESYHGKATLLGSDSVAKCSDCHGFHGILGPDQPASKVSQKNKLETCRKCHEGAPVNFAGFYAHADHNDPEDFAILFWVYTFMTLLLVSVFSFFGLHTLLWGIREGVDAIRHRGEPKKIYTGPRVIRFSKTDRILHFFVIVSFLGLAATGAPLKFAQASWARFTLGLLGGVEVAGALHRFFAIITFGYFFAHIIQLVRNLWPEFRKGRLISALLSPDSLVPRLSDITDVFAHFGWFLGIAKKPTWERWTYWEKFDYWAVFWGVAIIGSSGLILWFPAFFTHVLPGWVINVALVVHSDEALLAIGFIFGVHFFNSHLRRSKFPMDEVIFTGSVPKEEYEEERGRQWDRLQAEGRAESLFVDDPHPVFRTWARVFGISAWLSGLVILGLIIHGFITTH